MELLLVALGTLIVFSIGFYAISNRIESLENEFDKKRKDLDSKFESKEKEFTQKIESIKFWQKYLDFNIGDEVLFIIELTNTKKDESDINYTAYIDARIIDLTKSKAKIELIDVTTSVINSNRITKQGIENYLQRNPWYEFHKLERKITIEDRRDMKLNQILN